MPYEFNKILNHSQVLWSLYVLKGVESKYKEALTELYKILLIIVVLPPSSAGCERTFSKLRQRKIIEETVS